MKAFKTPLLVMVLSVFFMTSPAQGAVTYDLNPGQTVWLKFDTGSDWDEFNAMTFFWRWTGGPSPANVDWSIYTTGEDNGYYYDQNQAFSIAPGDFDILQNNTLTFMIYNAGTAESTLTLTRFEGYYVEDPYGIPEWVTATGYPYNPPAGLVGGVDMISSYFYETDPGGYTDLFYYDPLVAHDVYRSDFKRDLVPVPASALLLASGILALIGLRRKSG